MLRKHFHQRHNIQERWLAQIQMQIAGKAPPTPLERCHIKVVRHFWRMLDFDGVVGSMKIVVDCLHHETVGIIKDDNYAITGPWDVSQEYRKRALGPLLTIDITEV